MLQGRKRAGKGSGLYSVLQRLAALLLETGGAFQDAKQLPPVIVPKVTAQQLSLAHGLFKLLPNMLQISILQAFVQPMIGGNAVGKLMVIEYRLKPGQQLRILAQPIINKLVFLGDGIKL